MAIRWTGRSERGRLDCEGKRLEGRIQNFYSEGKYRPS